MLLQLSCDFTCATRAGRAEYKLTTSSSDPGNSKIIRSFEQYPIEKRIDIFLYAEACHRDPRFEPILARGGEAIVPYVVNRIEVENRAWEKIELIDVLIRINGECRCIRSYSAIVKRLESVGQELIEKAGSTDATYEKIYVDKVSTLKHQLEGG